MPHGVQRSYPEYPNDGGSGNSATKVPESEGSPGEKEPMPAPLSSMSDEDGNHDTSGQKANAQQHGRPTVMDYPDNLTGVIETDEPTKGEGSVATY